MTTNQALRASGWPASLFPDLLLEQLATAVYAIDLSGCFIAVNRAGSELTGCPASQLLGLHFERLFPPEQLPDIRRQFARVAFRGERVVGYETTLLRRDGTTVAVRLSGAPLVENARISGVVGIAEDISARKEAELALTRRTSDLDERIKELHCLYAVSRLAQEVEAGARGIPASLFRRIVNVIPPALRHAEHGAARLVVGEREYRSRSWRSSAHVLAREIRVDGRPAGRLELGYVDLPAGAPADPFLPEERELIDALADQLSQLLESDRARQALEEASARLRASEERFRNLVESTSDWVWETDRDGVYTYVSPQVRVLLGYAPEEVVGRTPFDFMPEDEAQRVRAVFEAAVAARRPIAGLENVHRRKDGRLVTLETNGVPFFDEAGGLAGYRGTDRDITERKQHEALLSDEKNILELIAASTPLAEVLAAVAHAFERQSHGRTRCAILLGEHATDLEVAAAPSLPEDFRRAILALARSAPDSPCATAILRRETVRAAEPGAGPAWSAYRALAAALGIRAVRACPILASDGAVLGALALCDGEAGDGRETAEPAERAARLAKIAIEKARAQERLAEMAYHDALTGLPNRLLLRDRLRQAMIEATRQERLLAVAHLDLDHFKRINDTLGHAAGDRLLVAVADRLAEALRPGDTISRQGGDEFTLVLAGLAQIDDASRVAQRIVEGFRRPVVLDGRELFVTCSLGLTVFPVDDRDIDALLRNADAAMYHAKEEGRNNFQFYDRRMNAESLERLVLENALRVAIEREELRLHYQPQVDARTGALIGAEALIRWQHPTLGAVPPARFIPLAEETGLIVPIGEWVLRRACADAAAWRAAGHPVRVAVNLSWRQFRQGDLVEQVRRALEAAGLPPDCLELELTESLLMRDVDKTVAALQALKRVGVSISVDDFGTGYSSLGYLRRFPIDTVKIDKSFIDGIAVDEESLTIVRTIIAMAHSLGKQIIAEGVETEAQAASLAREGCPRMQGYHFGRPIAAEEMAHYLRTRRDPAALRA